MDSRLDERPYCFEHIEGVALSEFEHIVSILAELESDFVPQDEGLHARRDCASLSELESLHAILDVIVPVKILMVVRQVEEFQNELEANLGQIFLEQE